MAEYRVVLRADLDSASHPLLWEPGCPLLIEAVQISRNTQTAECYLQTKVKNVSPYTVEGFELSVSIHLRDESTEDLCLQILDVEIRGGEEYSAKPLQMKGNDPISLQAVIRTINLGKTTWKSSNPPMPYPERPPLSLNSTQASERSALIEDLSHGSIIPDRTKAVIKQDGWWLCPCGALNVGRDTCHKCNFPLSTLSDLENPSLLEAKAAEREQAYQQNREHLAQKRKKAVFACKVATCILAAILIVAGIVYKVNDVFKQQIADQQNAIKYQEALEYLENDSPGLAYIRFYDLGDYEDSKSKAEDILNDTTLNNDYLEALKTYDENGAVFSLVTKVNLANLAAEGYKDSELLLEEFKEKW